MNITISIPPMPAVPRIDPGPIQRARVAAERTTGAAAGRRIRPPRVSGMARVVRLFSRLSVMWPLLRVAVGSAALFLRRLGPLLINISRALRPIARMFSRRAAQTSPGSSNPRSLAVSQQEPRVVRRNFRRNHDAEETREISRRFGLNSLRGLR